MLAVEIDLLLLRNAIIVDWDPFIRRMLVFAIVFPAIVFGRPFSRIVSVKAFDDEVVVKRDPLVPRE